MQMSGLPELPNNENRRARLQQLEHTRRRWRYNYTHIPGLALVDQVPDNQRPELGWWKAVGSRLVHVLRNNMVNDKREVDRSNRDHAANSLEGRLGLSVLKSIMDAVRETRALLDRRDPIAPGDSLAEYRDLFARIDCPPFANVFMSDAGFSWLHTAGPNPRTFHRITELPPNFPVTELDFQANVTFTGDSLTAALAEGRCYLADYALFHQIPDGSFPFGQKFTYAPMALFAVPKGQGPQTLTPVAIQCEQHPNQHTPILNTNDNWAWRMAKTVLSAAYGQHHELVAHLGRTHLMVEPFAVATHRQLAQDHPVFLLLEPHFQGNLYINHLAYKDLIAPEGGVDELAAATIEADQKIVVEQVQGTSFKDMAFPREIAARGVGDAHLDYPYRDVAGRYWDCIQKWVRDYLQLYYTSNAAVGLDRELTAWARELVAEDGGRIHNLTANNRINSLDDLVQVCTTVIFTASVQHAAVNFPQFTVMSFTPAVPLALYSAAPFRKTGADEERWLRMLPPIGAAELQLTLGYLLGTVHYTQLGQYNPHHFKDPRVAPVLAAFQQDLTAVGAFIQENNRGRALAYDTLVPADIPQSINI